MIQNANIKRNLLTGVVTAIPLLVTVFVFSFFLDLLANIGRPKLIVVSNAVKPVSPSLATLLLEAPLLSSGLAILFTLGMLYLLGWSMTRLAGRQFVNTVDELIRHIPVVTSVYGATKRLCDALQREGERGKAVVLIPFPHEGMKVVGLLTRVLIDEDTGEELAVVYVPTTPNPTSGYLEILPVAELVPLDWTVDQAMGFVVSGGTSAPERIRFRPRRGGSGNGTGGCGAAAAGPERPIDSPEPLPVPRDPDPSESSAPLPKPVSARASVPVETTISA
jgi:uncharacterized membrane protein